MSAKCAGCTKTVYHSERLQALDASWHPRCLKCTVCKTRLNLNNLNSFELQPYCKSHVPTVKATVVADDVMMSHSKSSQSLSSDSRREQLGTQKGTGEKPTATTDDQMMSHLRDAQAVASYSRSENRGTQKGTGEKPHQSSDDQMMSHLKDAQAVSSYSHHEQLGTQKGTGEKPTSQFDSY